MEWVNHEDFLTDLSRVVLIVAWTVGAWKLWVAGRRGCDEARPLRRFASLVAMYWVTFSTSFLVAKHAGWSIAWHNEASRIGTYFTVTVFLVWAFMAAARCAERERQGGA